MILVSLTAAQIFSFSPDTPKMISTAQDAIAVVDVGEDEDDVLNEVWSSSIDIRRILMRRRIASLASVTAGNISHIAQTLEPLGLSTFQQDK